ncbi:hypothetical protein DFJ58DRAFT_735531 [Suillus subalutaceus]|uniref:uncharacterized protein n=1 Tax=Suillus subalutaceus TaxID=48586 RepID=UPI001B8790A3|nr:uncharacterized protein DFJ58DRAFT_735531 [Suillus subalutaceus]KAG1835421.1 hypothetical protein DFJ58DRAFT_735531 [Suillus subalutaceus]
MKFASALILAFVAGVQAQPSVNISALPTGSLTLPTITISPPSSMSLPTLTLTAPTLTPPTMTFGPNSTTTSTSTSVTATSKSAAMAGSYVDTELVMGAVAGFFGVFAFLV